MHIMNQIINDIIQDNSLLQPQHEMKSVASLQIHQFKYFKLWRLLLSPTWSVTSIGRDFLSWNLSNLLAALNFRQLGYIQARVFGHAFGFLLLISPTRFWCH